MKKVVVDMFGADLGAEPVVRGSFEALEQHPELTAVFVGDGDLVKNTAIDFKVDPSQYSVIETDQYITNNDSPTCVFSGKENSSMVLALEHLKSDPDCIGIISAGNTGALMVGSIFKLGLYPGLKQPALSTALPRYDGGLVCLVDCGASMDCKPKDLARFALMGNAFMKSMCDTDNPRIGLLSVGRESKKGNELTLAAYSTLTELPVNFIGNIEGNDIFTGYADVVVTDGFAGNVILKNAEATGKSAIAVLDDLLGEEVKSSPVLSSLKQKLWALYDFNSQGGATFLGTKKIVVKMHGCATESTATACIEQILRLEGKGFNKFMAEAFPDTKANG